MRILFQSFLCFLLLAQDSTTAFCSADETVAVIEGPIPLRFEIATDKKIQSEQNKDTGKSFAWVILQNNKRLPTEVEESPDLPRTFALTLKEELHPVIVVQAGKFIIFRNLTNELLLLKCGYYDQPFNCECAGNGGEAEVVFREQSIIPFELTTKTREDLIITRVISVSDIRFASVLNADSTASFSALPQGKLTFAYWNTVEKVRRHGDIVIEDAPCVHQIHTVRLDRTTIRPRK